VNQRIDEMSGGFQEALVDYLCECAMPDCTNLLELSHSDYERVRSNPRHFAVVADEAHVFTDVERVVERNGRFWIVEKFAEAGQVAIETA
jgi:hypothetical protein